MFRAIVQLELLTEQSDSEVEGMGQDGGLRNGWQIECRIQREAGGVETCDTVWGEGGEWEEKGEKQAQETNAAGQASRAR